jgi:hypothetical protein
MYYWCLQKLVKSGQVEGAYFATEEAQVGGVEMLRSAQHDRLLMTKVKSNALPSHIPHATVIPKEPVS